MIVRDSLLTEKSQIFFSYFIKILVISWYISRASIVTAGQANTNPSLLSKFWNIGCEFSGVVTRVRRSTPNPVPEEPNFDDPEELFRYLYPLADVQPGGSIGDGARSSQGTHSLSSWLEDLMELWHAECQQRRSKRSTTRKKANQTPSPRGPLNTASKYTVSRSRGTLVSSIRRSGTGDYRGFNGSYADPYPQSEGAPGSGYDDFDIYPGGTYKKEEIEQEIMEIIDDKKKPSTTTTTEKPTDKPTDAPAPKEDIFFAQYGGDIEYFFPLISFGIPFDGEITLLGFHGFRGIFPY